jgi:hypothetical protein
MAPLYMQSGWSVCHGNVEGAFKFKVEMRSGLFMTLSLVAWGNRNSKRQMGLAMKKNLTARKERKVSCFKSILIFRWTNRKLKIFTLLYNMFFWKEIDQMIFHCMFVLE